MRLKYKLIFARTLGSDLNFIKLVLDNILRIRNIRINIVCKRGKK